MKKHFYSHIVDIETIHTALEVLELEKHEKTELIILVETHVHHVVLDTVLSELKGEDKKTFLKHLAEEKHDRVWKLLQDKVDHVELKIHKAVEKLKKELHADIVEAHKKKKLKKK